MPKQISMPTAVKEHLETKMIGEEISGFKVKEYKGSGNTAVTYKVYDSDGLPWALKLVTVESYGNRAPFREISRFSEAADERFLVFPKGVGDWNLKLKGKKYQFIWFKSRFVDGVTLQKFMASCNQLSLEEEVKRFIEHLTAALEELQRLGFSHGDLHDRNIMREIVGAKGSLPEIKYVIIDFSEAHPVESVEEGLSKDLESIGHHLRTFSEYGYTREVLTREDEKVLDAIKHIPGLLDDTSAVAMGISRPSQILDRYRDGLRAVEIAPRKLNDPFNPLSSDYIANDALLADLCITQMWWTEELKKNTNVLLIGPRGCGKTMIFRRLRLKTKIYAKKSNEIATDPYVAFYLPCESLFYMRFSDFAQVDIEKNKNALVLFFNMGVAAEVASTLAVLKTPLGPVSQSATSTISKVIIEEAAGVWNELGLPKIITSMTELSSCAESIMRFVRKSLAYGNPVPAQGSTDFVKQLVDCVKGTVTKLSGRHFIFLLDDYTEERVPIGLQEALHPIVSQRSPHICFKISGHMFGTIYNNPRPLALDEGRNFEMYNLGTIYLNRNRRKTEGKALLRILDERFKHSESYHGTVEGWLGKTSYPGGRTLSQALHDKNTRASVHYHGLQCLMDLCSGDYSEMIRMVGEIFREAGVDPKAACNVIAPAIQSRAIERVSREYLSRIRHIRPDGQKLFDIVTAFGNLSKDLLYNHSPVRQGSDTKGNTRKDPYDFLNAYVDDLVKAMPAAKETWKRLQKASIFVDVGVAPSQRRIIADRATLRRIYCPAFRTMLTSSEHRQLTRQQFELFMDRPEEFRRELMKSTKASQGQSTYLQDKEAVEDKTSLDDWKDNVSLPQDKDRIDLISKAKQAFVDSIGKLPQLQQLSSMFAKGGNFDLYVGAIGFEDRTTNASTALAERGVRVSNAIIFEYDINYEANDVKRAEYERILLGLTEGKPYRPMNAPIGSPDPVFAERLGHLLRNVHSEGPPKIIFDVTSCPSLILSEGLRIFLNYECDLTLLYSEPLEYFPTRNEWESGNVKPKGGKVQGPFSGVRFVAKPPILQADDTGELPVLLVLFPTFNRERTDGVIADLDPAKRIWIFGEPHDMAKDDYRVDMAKSFAAPIMYPGDPWAQVTTFDYRKTFHALSAIYSENRFKNRIVVMAHGSKLQNVGAGLFAATHQVSLVFAMPKTYDPQRYSRGCGTVWGLPLGPTATLLSKLRAMRTLENGRSV